MVGVSRVAPGYLVLRTRFFSARVHGRRLLLLLSALLLALAVAGLSLCFGDVRIPPAAVWHTIIAGGPHARVVLGWRFPVSLAALVFGALLALGGAIVQSLTKNPLGSPDIIGFDAGSYTGVVLTILVLGHETLAWTAPAALLGGLLTALLVYVLSYRRGVAGFRLIIVGIGVSAILGSINAYVITRAHVDDAMLVGFWAAGSITRVTWQSLMPALIAAAALCVVLVPLSRWLVALEIGDDAAATHGVPVGVARLALMVLGVATSAIVTASAGPIGFIALAAPQVARRVFRTPGVSLVGSAIVGAGLLSGAHLLSLLTSQLYRAVPVGIMTMIIGGVYLLVLLIRQSRKGVSQ
nr:iron chelate uptake ABC transporter family permease subunit [Corynebacterium uropygiale]